MKKVFFSYTLKDKEINKDFLYQIKEWLNKQNIDSFIDLIDNVYEVELFQVKLIEELKKCDTLFIVHTSKYNESKWANIEIEEAEKRNLTILKVDYSVLQNAINRNFGIEYVLKNQL